MKQENELVLDLIKEVGIHRLCDLDGCICSGFTVRNVTVDIACGKGRGRGIWVYSNSMDYDMNEGWLEPILAEVLRQAEALGDGRGPFKTYLRPWKREDDIDG